MALEIDAVGPGLYEAVLTPPTGAEAWATSAPMTADALKHELRIRGVHPRDIGDVIAGADKYFTLGLSDRMKALHALRRSAQRVGLSADEKRTLIFQLSDPHDLVEKTYIAGILSLSPTREVIRAFADVLTTTRDEYLAPTLLGILADCSASDFEVAALPFLRGVAWDSTGRTRDWALLHAARAIQQTKSQSLLDVIIDVARRDVDALARLRARRALALVAGLPLAERTSLDEATTENLITAARNAIGE